MKLPRTARWDGQSPLERGPKTLRLGALQAAIAARAPWHEIEFAYDQVRSSAERVAGVRGRAVDVSREEESR